MGRGGHAGFYSINIYIPLFFLEFYARSLLGLCVQTVLQTVQKFSKKALAKLKDHLEFSLRPIQKKPNDLWAVLDQIQKNWISFRHKIKILRLKHYFPLKEPHNSLSL